MSLSSVKVIFMLCISYICTLENLELTVYLVISDDFIIVKPENSEANRRIGAKGTNCILHISPWGVTLALLSTRTVLAQWPLKSIRYFEAVGNGQFMLEAGRIAPMGDGTYIFHTEDGKDNFAYDLLDQRIVDALTKMQVLFHAFLYIF